MGDKQMKSIYKVNVTIQDKGEVFTRTEEVIAKNYSELLMELRKQLKKYRTALGMSKTFSIKNYEAQHVGWV